MNYKKIYYNIVKNARLSNRKKKEMYYENHHIIPKCMGGNEDMDNMVLLTAKEHFICHMLLCRIYPKNYKLSAALFRLVNPRGKQGYKVSARTYEIIKIKCSEDRKDWFNTPEGIEFRKQLSDSNKGEKNPMFNKPITEETRKRLSDAKKGEKNNFYGKTHTEESNEKNRQAHMGKKQSVETINKRVEKMKGHIVTPETREKISKSNSGKNNHMFGKHPSKETLVKMSVSHKWFKHSEESINKMREIAKNRKPIFNF